VAPLERLARAHAGIQAQLVGGAVVGGGARARAIRRAGRARARRILALRIAGVRQVLHREGPDAHRLFRARLVVAAVDGAIASRLRQIADARAVGIAVGADGAAVAHLARATGAPHDGARPQRQNPRPQSATDWFHGAPSTMAHLLYDTRAV